MYISTNTLRIIQEKIRKFPKGLGGNILLPNVNNSQKIRPRDIVAPAIDYKTPNQVAWETFQKEFGIKLDAGILASYIELDWGAFPPKKMIETLNILEKFPEVLTVIKENSCFFPLPQLYFPSEIMDKTIETIDVAQAATGGKRIFVLIGGPDCSGKTTLSNELERVLIQRGKHTLALHMDEFVTSRDERKEREEMALGSGAGEWDDVYAWFNHARIIETLTKIVSLPYNGTCHNLPLTGLYSKKDGTTTGSRPQGIDIYDDSIIFLEGNVAFAPHLRMFGSVLVQVDIPFHESLKRALWREVQEKGYPIEKVVAQHLLLRIPNGYLYQQAIKPLEIANLVIKNEDLTNPSILVRTQKSLLAKTSNINQLAAEELCGFSVQELAVNLLGPCLTSIDQTNLILKVVREAKITIEAKAEFFERAFSLLSRTEFFKEVYPLIYKTMLATILAGGDSKLIAWLVNKNSEAIRDFRRSCLDLCASDYPPEEIFWFFELLAQQSQSIVSQIHAQWKENDQDTLANANKQEVVETLQGEGAIVVEENENLARIFSSEHENPTQPRGLPIAYLLYEMPFFSS